MGSKIKSTVLYHRWQGMKERCNPSIKSCSKYHAGKGISICPEWMEYKNFEEWALANGFREDLTLDRIDGDDDYYPDNCRWVDNKTQSSNLSETALRERKTREELNRLKPKKRKRQVDKELEEFRMWYSKLIKKDLKDIPCFWASRKYMKILIEQGIYEPGSVCGK